MRIPLPPFEPDKSKFDSSVSGNVLNVYPSASGWKPMPDYVEISQSLGSTCKGATFVRTASGTYRIVACTQTGIYQLNTTDYSWTDITGPSGPYTGPSDQEAWTLTRFGGKLVIHNYNDPIQVYDIEAGGTVADLAGTPPQAKYSWVSGDFLILGYLNQANGQKTVYWSEVNNIESWRSGKNGSDFQVLPEGDEIMGGFAEQGGFTVIQRAGMQFFPFAPASGFTFTRTVLNPKQGSVAPRSIVSIGPGQFFYLSEDGFFGGVNRQAIGAERVDSWFLDQIDQTYLQDVQGVADPFEKVVWWRYRTPVGTYKLLGYDWQLDRWFASDLLVGEMVALATPALSWDGLGTLYATIDDVTEPFDSRLFTGGRPTFATFSPDNKLAYFTGSNLEATIDTAQVEPDPIRRTFCKGSRVQTDATGFTVAHGTAPYHGQAVTFATASSQNRAGYCPHRGDGRLHQFRVSIPAGTVWTVASSIEADFKLTGES